MAKKKKDLKKSPFLKSVTKEQLREAEYKVAIASGDYKKANKLKSEEKPKEVKKTKPSK
jgi:hypothetical protein